MPDSKKLDPDGERAAATQAMDSTPISGKEHEYRADGDHHPRQDGEVLEGKQDADPHAAAQAEPHIAKGIPGAGRPPETDSAPKAD